MREAAGRAPTGAQLERRRQIVDATIGIIGRVGWAGCSLQRVADEIGVTKAAVIYHIGTKVELVQQAYDEVIETFVEYVTGEIAAATDPLDAVLRFARAHLHFVRLHPDHARVIVEALDDANPTTIEDSPHSHQRYAPLVALIETARDSSDRRGSGTTTPVDATTLAVVIAGAIDRSTQAWLEDPTFDLDSANRAIGLLITAAV